MASRRSVTAPEQPIQRLSLLVLREEKIGVPAIRIGRLVEDIGDDSRSMRELENANIKDLNERGKDEMKAVCRDKTYFNKA